MPSVELSKSFCRQPRPETLWAASARGRQRQRSFYLLWMSLRSYWYTESTASFLVAPQLSVLSMRYCSRDFKSPEYLKDHQAIHNKMAKCSSCPRVFAREDIARMHNLVCDHKTKCVQAGMLNNVETNRSLLDLFAAASWTSASWTSASWSYITIAQQQRPSISPVPMVTMFRQCWTSWN